MHDVPTPPTPTPHSERSFGLQMGAILLLLAGWLWFKEVRGSSMCSAAAGLLLVLAGLLRPGLLSWPNRMWFRLGLALHAVVSPLVLGLIFFGIFTPVAWALRLFGRDALKRKFDPALASYWVDRSPPGPEPDSFHRQF